MEMTNGKIFLPPEEKAAYTEFKRSRREAQILLTLRKLLFDASHRETDGPVLKKICEFAKKNDLSGVLVSPVNVSAAKRLLAGSHVRVVCLVGGSGETLPAVKKYEAKKAVRYGADELRLVPCYSALLRGNLAFLRREVRRVKRAVRLPVTVSLEDRTLGEEDVALGVRAACDGGANAVCVRGETPLLLRAVEAAAGRAEVDCAGVENAEQLRSLIALGALRLVSSCADKVSDELLSLIPEKE